MKKDRFPLKLLSCLLIIALAVTVFPIGPNRAFATPPAQLKDASAGNVISYGGINWILLNPATGYVVSSSSQGNRQFDPDNTNQFDPDDTNNIAYWLNDASNGFMRTLIDGSANTSWIVSETWTVGPYSRESDETINDLPIGLMSVNEFNEFQSLLPNTTFFNFQTRTRWEWNTYEIMEIIFQMHPMRGPNVHSANLYMEVFPALYLDPELSIASGDGSTGSPYALSDRTNPAGSTLTVSKPTVTANGVESSTITVALNGLHPVTGHTVALAQGGSSVISTVYEMTNASGEAVFMVTSTKAEAVTYTATDTTDGVTVTQTANVTFDPGTADPARSALVADPTPVLANGVASKTLTVTLMDAFDNPIPGHTVSLSQGGGSSAITPVSATTDSNGQAVFTVTDTRGEIVTYMATDTTDSVMLTQTAQVTFTAISTLPSAPTFVPTIDLNGISLDPAKIDITKPSVTLEATPKDGAAYVSIPASILTSFEGKNAAFFIEFKTPYGSYRVPVNLASLIPGLKDLLAKNNLKAEDISFKIRLTDKSGDTEIQAAFANGFPSGKAMGAIVDFRIDIVNSVTGQTIGTADKLSKALTRMIPMPKDMKDIPAQWGAFRYNETTRKFEFVAAKKVLIDGVWYVMLSSNSNSAHVVAENAVSFADTLKHWSKPFVEMAAAKGLVEGVGAGKYAPNQSVTRGEFTAMLVRALGRGTSSGSTAPYDDVKAGAWYFDAVANAKELGLLDFASGKSFMPDQPLTREEMASMLAAVVALEKIQLTKEYVSLDGFKDIADIDSAFLQDVLLMVKLNIMTGTSANTFDPKGETTRSQAAAVFIRALQALGMIEG